MSGNWAPITPMSRGENLAESNVPLKASPLWVQMTGGRFVLAWMRRMCSTMAMPFSSSKNQPLWVGPSPPASPRPGSPQPQ